MTVQLSLTEIEALTVRVLVVALAFVTSPGAIE